MGIDLSNPAEPLKIPEGIRVSVARNAWTQFVIQVDGGLHRAGLRLPHVGNGIVFSAYQVLSVPVDLNEAEYVRMTGSRELADTEPRVLMPLAISDGVVDLSRVRTRAGPGAGPGTGPGLGPESGPVLIWIDAHVGTNVTPGNYDGEIQLMAVESASLPLKLTVENLTLPDELHLHIAAPLDWLGLSRQYPDLFEQTPARLLVRTDPRQERLMGLLDCYMRLAHANDTDFFVPQLQPIVKWPLGKEPAIDWSDFDAVVSPWLSGSAFIDRRPVGYWPLPGTEMVNEILDSKLTDQYWGLADAHFAQNHWARVSSGGVAFAAGRPFAGKARCVSTADRPDAGFTEQSMRSIAWQAFAEDAGLVLCDAPLLSTDQRVKGDQIILAYPGEPFGVDAPLPTVQLKWLRQAEQDYEYLLLSKQRNPDTEKICQLVTQPVELKGDRSAPPLMNRFAGLSDSHACERARQLLVSTMARGVNASGVDDSQLETIRWLADRERQTIIPASVDWKWDLKDSRIAASLDLVIYNTAPAMQQGGHLQWMANDNGWDVSSANAAVGAIDRFHLANASLVARFDPAVISTISEPVEIRYTDDFTRQTTASRVSLPVGVTQRRHEPLVVDGNLSDWYPADALLLNRPLVRMLSERWVQADQVEYSAVPASIYSGWSDDNFYLAFRLGGVVASDLRSTRNFVQYDHGRAWGEDLCEILMQPIYIDNFVGPLLHVVCKPGGSWVEQRAADGSWQPFEASGLRYASGVDAGEKVWRGEVALPWKAINAAGHGRPALLRFNFIQHRQANGESASWAGPIDQSRDGKLTGLVLIKE